MDFARYDACFGPAAAAEFWALRPRRSRSGAAAGRPHVDARDGRRPAGPADGRGAAGSGICRACGTWTTGGGSRRRSPPPRRTGSRFAAELARCRAVGPPMNVVRQVRGRRAPLGRPIPTAGRAAGRRRTALPAPGRRLAKPWRSTRWCAGGRRGPGAPGPLRPGRPRRRVRGRDGTGRGAGRARAGTRQSTCQARPRRVAPGSWAGGRWCGRCSRRCGAGRWRGRRCFVDGNLGGIARTRGAPLGPDGRELPPRRPVDRRDRAGRHRRAGHRPAGRERWRSGGREQLRSRARLRHRPRCSAMPGRRRGGSPTGGRRGGRHCVALAHPRPDGRRSADHHGMVIDQRARQIVPSRTVERRRTRRSAVGERRVDSTAPGVRQGPGPAGVAVLSPRALVALPRRHVAAVRGAGRETPIRWWSRRARTEVCCAVLCGVRAARAEGATSCVRGTATARGVGAARAARVRRVRDGDRCSRTARASARPR